MSAALFEISALYANQLSELVFSRHYYQQCEISFMQILAVAPIIILICIFKAMTTCFGQWMKIESAKNKLANLVHDLFHK
jgi:hypothetical protein